MEELFEYLDSISQRGDRYGRHDGVLDLLQWCGKTSTRNVTLEEAKRFYENPRQPYQQLKRKE